jgi:hypothetical protein
VFFLNRKQILSVRTFAAGEFTQERKQALIEEAAKLLP